MKTFARLILAAAAFILVGYTGVMGYVAVNTERDVQFWPPRIGPVPQSAAVVDMSDLGSELSEIKAILNDELVALNARLAEARKNMAAQKSVGGVSNYEWRQNVRSYESDVHDVEDELISRINKLERKMESVNRNCLDLSGKS
jgi:hypothetical protein